jgi:hypothetical protein
MFLLLCPDDPRPVIRTQKMQKNLNLSPRLGSFRKIPRAGPKFVFSTRASPQPALSAKLASFRKKGHGRG